MPDFRWRARYLFFIICIGQNRQRCRPLNCLTRLICRKNITFTEYTNFCLHRVINRCKYFLTLCNIRLYVRIKWLRLCLKVGLQFLNCRLDELHYFLSLNGWHTTALCKIEFDARDLHTQHLFDLLDYFHYMSTK